MTDKSNPTGRTYFTQRGRDAFVQAMRLCGLPEGGTILLPAYIGITDREGSGVFDPVEMVGASYDLYAVDETLSPIAAEFQEKLSREDVAGALVIHYFGFPPKNFDALVRTCQGRKKFLIEDCAHALYSFSGDQQLGSFGDASFFSIHKLLPTESGGILQVNGNKACTGLHDDIADAARTAYRQADLQKIQAARRDNYRYLAQALSGARPFFETMPDGVTPMNFPVWIEGNRDDFYFKMLEHGVRISSLYYRLISQIEENRYPRSYDISRHISNLPIHQDMTHADIDRMLAVLHDVLTNRI